MMNGIITMRNEDGTQFWDGVCWTPFKRHAKIVPYEEFVKLEKRAKDSRKNDSPDHGFFGIYNLRFREV